jgi:hypothetical protein
MANEHPELTETAKTFSELWQSSKHETPERQRRTALAASLDLLAQCLDRTVTPDMARGYMAVLSPLTPAQCIKAFSTALERCRYFPSPAELRSLGSPVDALEDPERTIGMGMLRHILQAMRTHGPQLRPVPGSIIRDRDDDGRVLPVSEWTRAADSQPPKFPIRVITTIRNLGMGSWEAGLELISAHPAARPTDDRRHLDARSTEFQARDAAKLEERWMQAWRAAEVA